MGLDVSEHGLLTAYGGFAMLPDTTALDGDAAAAPVQVPGDVPPAEAVPCEEDACFLGGIPQVHQGGDSL